MSKFLIFTRKKTCEEISQSKTQFWNYSVPLRFLEALEKTSVQSLALETARTALRESKDLTWSAPHFSRLLWDLVGIASEVQDFSTLADSFQALCDRKQAIEVPLLPSSNLNFITVTAYFSITNENDFKSGCFFKSFSFEKQFSPL